MNKKLLAVFLTMVMILTALSGCNVPSIGDSPDASPYEKPEVSNGSIEGSEVSNGSLEPPNFKIGFPFINLTTDPFVNSLISPIKNACEAAGGELVIDDWDMTPDGIITSIQKLINSGVDGIMVMPPAESHIPVINQICEEANVPYVIVVRNIMDPDIKALLDSSPVFAGNTYEAETETAYKAVKDMAALGVTNMAVINISKGDAAADLREAGIAQAVEETGINILTEARNLMNASDVSRTVEGFIAAYPEIDGVFVAAALTMVIPTITKVLEDNNLLGKVIIGKIDAENTEMLDSFEKGALKVLYCGHQQIDLTLGSLLLINRVMGTPVSEDPAYLEIKMFPVSTFEEAADYFKFIQGGVPIYTAEEIKQLLKYYNPDVTLETLQTISNNYGLEEVKARRKDIVDE